MAVYVIAEFGSIAADTHAVAHLDKGGVGRFGERMLVDSGRCELLVGDRAPNRITVLEFPTMEQAQAWWAAREHSAPAGVRHVERKMILVEGL